MVLYMLLRDEAGRGQAPPLLYAPQRTTSVYGRGTPCGCPGAAQYAAFLCLILSLFTACSGAANGQSIIKRTPPAKAAGEVVLPHSQVHFHDAPLPTGADFNFTGNDWTL